MKKFRKLVPAFAMLLVSATVLASTTFAWFSMNNTVTATGMTVQAQASSTLLIDTASATSSAGKLTGGADTKATTANAPADGIRPTSTVDGTNWFSAEAAATNAATAKTGSYEAVAAGNVGNYRLASTFYLQTYDGTKSITAGSLDAANKKIVIDSVTVAYTAGDALASSFRVMIVVGDTVVVCAPTTTTTPSNQGVASVTTGTATKSDLTFATVSGIDSGKATLSANNDLVAAVNYNQVYTANVYLFFDGEDSACYTDNIPATLNNYTVTVSFSLADAN